MIYIYRKNADIEGNRGKLKEIIRWDEWEIVEGKGVLTSNLNYGVSVDDSCFMLIFLLPHSSKVFSPNGQSHCLQC